MLDIQASGSIGAEQHWPAVEEYRDTMVPSTKAKQQQIIITNNNNNLKK